MISGRQCRAARSFLGWSQPRMCEVVPKLYKAKLIHFENTGQIDEKTHKAIQELFLFHGVVFCSNGSILLEW